MGDIFACRVFVVIERIDQFILAAERKSVQLRTLDHFRRGKYRLVCKQHDLLFIAAPFISAEYLLGNSIRDVLKYCQTNKGDQPQDRAFRDRHNIQAGEQVKQCVRTELTFPLGNQAAPYQPLHTFRSRTVRHIAGFPCLVFIQRFDLIVREDTPVQN